MVETLAIERVTLYNLEQNFNLQLAQDAHFFDEWQQNLPPLTIAERERLERVQSTYANLEKRSLLENTVKMAILSPLLDLAGFFLPPFYVDTETSVDIETEEGNLKLRGRMDVLVLMQRFWILGIESKRAEFSLKVGIPQVLSYMLARPHPDRPVYGLVSNGHSFVFLKCQLGTVPHYAKSKEFILDQDEGLALTLRVMKRLGAIVTTSL
ncbi:MAG: restriction endonuclease subunit R [Prochlorotrichaceae cyanobacterium]|jgi:hypothetical protein